MGVAPILNSTVRSPFGPAMPSATIELGGKVANQLAAPSAVATLLPATVTSWSPALTPASAAGPFGTTTATTGDIAIPLSIRSIPVHDRSNVIVPDKLVDNASSMSLSASETRTRSATAGPGAEGHIQRSASAANSLSSSTPRTNIDPGSSRLTVV